ncbi:hypothetical protein GAH_00508 [Geoglobus ahangari]|uniref:Uncharacterized protein n=1 Tax=Geoglobus ahangari TaxID=113653 RepID=A0A0F7IEW4_9EURY|nr:hypothetical protein [Geoglobus ahangari]AKG92145.1 hypothetical protein GAH_00508 [Geoglobus ahangari]
MNLVARVILAFVVLTAVGLIALPSTVSLFAGQHYWYDISGAGSQIPCEKCHADVYEELRNNPYHENFECELCHRGVNITYASDRGGGTIISGKEAHAASIVSCLICHSGNEPAPWSEQVNHSHAEYNTSDSTLCSKCHSPSLYPPIAGGFGLTGETGDTGALAAHREFVLEAKGGDLLLSANEACIACHTHVAVKITWNHSRALEFNIGFGNPITTANGPHNWTITSWTINGTATAVVWGNTTGSGSTTYSTNWPGNVPGVNYK